MIMIKTHDVVKVGIADLNIVKAPNMIRTSGLGSCVGVVIYDLPNKIAGLAHVMLPDSALAKEPKKNIYKYADTAVVYLIELLLKNGASKYSLKADRKSTRLNSSHVAISYAVFCLKKK